MPRSQSSHQFLKTATWIVVVLFLSGLLTPTYAKLRPTSPQPHDVTITLVAEYFRLARTTIGPNHTYYLGILRTKNNPAMSIVKISYQNLDFETDIPSDLITLRREHRFKAVRDERCDQRLGAIRKLLNASKSSAWKDVLGDADNTEQIVQCWVITPGDYKGSRVIQLNIADMQIGF